MPNRCVVSKYKVLNFLVPKSGIFFGKMGISEKLDKDSHKSCFKWFNMFENNDLILIVTYIATGWPKKRPSNFDTLQISSFWIRNASSFFHIKWGIFLGHPVAIYVTIRIRSLFSNILNQLKQLLWESLSSYSSFSEIPIFPSTEKVSFL